jgi:hypothetical protein
MGNQTSNEPGWLVKDFDVLYRAASELVEQVDSELLDERNLFGRDALAALEDARSQLQRLAPAQREIQALKASLMPRVANQDQDADRARGKGD